MRYISRDSEVLGIEVPEIEVAETWDDKEMEMENVGNKVRDIGGNTDNKVRDNEDTKGIEDNKVQEIEVVFSLRTLDTSHHISPSSLC